MHVIEPIIKYEKQWVVKADVFKRKPATNRYLEVNDRYQHPARDISRGRKNT